MSVSKTVIYNLALGHLGVKPVTVDTENTVQALTLTRFWDPARQDTLAMCDWGFATVEALLTEVANYTPPPGWTYGYAKPAKSLAMWKIYNAVGVGVFVDPDTGRTVLDEGLLRAQSQNEFKRIFDPTLSVQVYLSNVPDAYGSYTYDMDDVSQFTPGFVTAMGLQLAAAAAVSLTGDGDKAKTLAALASLKASEEERKSSYETKKQTGNQTIVDSRS